MIAYEYDRLITFALVTAELCWSGRYFISVYLSRSQIAIPPSIKPLTRMLWDSFIYIEVIRTEPRFVGSLSGIISDWVLRSKTLTIPFEFPIKKYVLSMATHVTTPNKEWSYFFKA